MVPLRAVLDSPPGSIGGRQPAYPAMRSHMAERHEQRLVEALVAQTAALDIAVLLRLAGRNVVPLEAAPASTAGSPGWSARRHCR